MNNINDPLGQFYEKEIAPDAGPIENIYIDVDFLVDCRFAVLMHHAAAVTQQGQSEELFNSLENGFEKYQTRCYTSIDGVFNHPELTEENFLKWKQKYTLRVAQSTVLSDQILEFIRAVRLQNSKKSYTIDPVVVVNFGSYNVTREFIIRVCDVIRNNGAQVRYLTQEPTELNPEVIKLCQMIMIDDFPKFVGEESKFHLPFFDELLFEKKWVIARKRLQSDITLGNESIDTVFKRTADVICSAGFCRLLYFD